MYVGKVPDMLETFFGNKTPTTLIVLLRRYYCYYNQQALGWPHAFIHLLRAVVLTVGVISIVVCACGAVASSHNKCWYYPSPMAISQRYRLRPLLFDSLRLSPKLGLQRGFEAVKQLVISFLLCGLQ